MGKKSKARRREESQVSSRAPEVAHPSAAEVEAGSSAPELAIDSPVAAASVMAKASAEIAAAVPSLNQLSAEILAAHDSFVRSPSAVVESLGIRVATAVARKLASSIPPPPSLSEKQPIEA